MTIRVLVADDQSMVRAGFRMLLAGEEDIEVVAEAGNGLEAVNGAARFHPTVILMDIRMPELDGLEATRRILAADDSARVLILTTFDLDEYVYEALAAGASGFVLKDDPSEQLLAAIRTVAAGDALLSPTVTKRVIHQFSRLPRPTPPATFAELTAREHEVFRLMADGLSNAEIAARLFISETTVKTHITHILQKLHLRDRVARRRRGHGAGLRRQPRHAGRGRRHLPALRAGPRQGPPSGALRHRRAPRTRQGVHPARVQGDPAHPRRQRGGVQAARDRLPQDHRRVPQLPRGRNAAHRRRRRRHRPRPRL